MEKLLLSALIVISFVIFSGCIIPTYEDAEGNTQIGFPPSSNIDEKPIINDGQLEQEIHRLVNIERQKHGLSSLEYDDLLANIARDHSNDMNIYGFFDHYNFEGQGPTERAIEVGYPIYKDLGNGWYSESIGENIFQNNLYSSVVYYGINPVYDWKTQNEIASSTVDGWMSSSGHRQNILDSSYDKEGIGISLSADYEVYITQDFW